MEAAQTLSTEIIPSETASGEFMSRVRTVAHGLDRHGLLDGVRCIDIDGEELYDYEEKHGPFPNGLYCVATQTIALSTEPDTDIGYVLAHEVGHHNHLSPIVGDLPDDKEEALDALDHIDDYRDVCRYSWDIDLAVSRAGDVPSDINFNPIPAELVATMFGLRAVRGSEFSDTSREYYEQYDGPEMVTLQAEELSE